METPPVAAMPPSGGETTRQSGALSKVFVTAAFWSLVSALPLVVLTLVPSEEALVGWGTVCVGWLVGLSPVAGYRSAIAAPKAVPGELPSVATAAAAVTLAYALIAAVHLAALAMLGPTDSGPLEGWAAILLMAVAGSLAGATTARHRHAG